MILNDVFRVCLQQGYKGMLRWSFILQGSNSMIPRFPSRPLIIRVPFFLIFGCKGDPI